MSTPPPLPASHRRGVPRWVWFMLVAVTPLMGWLALERSDQVQREAQALDAWSKAIEASDRGDHEHALLRLEQAEALGGALPEFALQRAFDLVQLERYDEALKVYEASIDAKCAEGGDWLWYGHTMYELNHREAARAAFEKSVDLDDSCSEAWTWLGTTNFEEGRFDEATAALEEALSRDGASQHAQAWLGYALSQMGKDEEARAALERALELGEEDDGIRRWLTRNHLTAGRVDEAARVLEPAREATPDASWVLLNSAEIETLRGRSGEAEKYLREAVARWPEDQEGWYELGLLLHREGKLEEAEDRFRMAIELAESPEAEAARLQLGRVLRDAGQMQEALVVLSALVGDGPYNVEALYERGVAYQRLGRHRDAIAAYERVLEARPDFPSAVERLKDARERLAKAKRK